MVQALCPMVTGFFLRTSSKGLPFLSPPGQAGFGRQLQQWPQGGSVPSQHLPLIKAPNAEKKKKNHKGRQLWR